MTTDAGSQELRDLAGRLVGDLGSLQAQLVHHDDTSHMQHMEFCDRAADFAAYVDSALLLSEHRRFAQALSLLRSALDHWAADLVTLLGDRFVQLYPEATEAMLADAVRRREAGELERVVEEPRLVGKNNSKLRIVWRGLTSDDGEVVLHPLYFEAQNYDPFYGNPDDQPQFADWFTDTRDHAVEQRQRYNAFFQWGALVDSLALNGIVQERHRLHLNTHYRFLSAFAHSHHAAHGILQPRSVVAAQGMPHAVDELVLLYAVQLSARYLRAFVAMTERPPQVGLANRGDLDHAIRYGLERSAHLWFLTDEPTVYDRAQELMVRAAEQQTFTQRTPEEATALDPAAVRYYRNPLERLKQMHRTFREMTTGFTYVSPWQ